ncbi:hypothetical protein KSP40_PGU019395 [Platanthera guangdongensis]|uniref:Uncharacterized protein n=1 Tax=Platanthera guangdongensis TaxID=2320717 RepID=A0ABR2MTA8_9ASPA
MDNNYQRLIDTTRQQFSEHRHSTLTLQRKQEQEINQRLQMLDEIRLALDDEETLTSLPIVLDEQIPTVINSTPIRIEDDHNTSLHEQINITTESIMPAQKDLQKLNDLAHNNKPPMQAEYDFVLSSSTAAIKNNHEDVFEEHYFVIAPTEFILSIQGTTRIQVFDPDRNKLARMDSHTLKTLSMMVSTEFARSYYALTFRIFVFDPGGIIEVAQSGVRIEEKNFS